MNGLDKNRSVIVAVAFFATAVIAFVGYEYISITNMLEPSAHTDINWMLVSTSNWCFTCRRFADGSNLCSLNVLQLVLFLAGAVALSILLWQLLRRHYRS